MRYDARTMELICVADILALIERAVDNKEISEPVTVDCIYAVKKHIERIALSMEEIDTNEEGGTV